MNAQLLADLLLEMNILNPGDLKREVRKLGAHLADPKARQWFMRSVTYWMINIDQLMAKPYKAIAEPRSHTSSKYRHLAHQAGNLPPSALVKYGLGQYDKPPKEETGEYKFKTGLEKPEPGTLMIKPSEWKGEEKTDIGIFVCPECKGVGTKNGHACPKCHGSGRVRQKVIGSTAQPLYIEIKRNPNARIKGEGHFPEGYSGPRLAAHLLEEDPPLDPEGTYTSMLHQPDVEKQLAQNFTPFLPSKALPKKKTMYGDPWGKEQVPAWASDEKQLYHFNPVQVRRRELFQRLEGVVNYLNYLNAIAQEYKEGEALTAATAQAKSEGEEVYKGFVQDQQKAKEARDVMRTLETMKTEDIDGFRKLMRDAENFGTQVREQPWLFTKDMRILSNVGVYKLIKAQSISSTVMLAQRQPDESTQTNNWPKTDWCVRMDCHAKGYLEDHDDPMLYFIDKENKPYVLIHFGTSQCKDVFDHEITANQAHELAPVCARSVEMRNRLAAWPAKAPTKGSERVGLSGLAYYTGRVKL